MPGRELVVLLAVALLLSGVLSDRRIVRGEVAECGRSGHCLFVSTVPYNTTGCGEVCGETEACACDSIQSAIDAVPSNATGNVMLVAAAGIYTGPGNVGVDFHGIAGALVAAEGASATKIICSPGEAAFLFHSGESESTQVSGFGLDTCTLSVSNRSSPFLVDLVFESSEALLSAAEAMLRVEDLSYPTLINCTFRDVALLPTYPTLSAIVTVTDAGASFEDCTFRNNSGSVGVVHVSVNATTSSPQPTVFRGCSFADNAGEQFSVGAFEQVNVTFDACHFLGNRQATVGTIVSSGSLLHVYNSTFRQCASSVILATRLSRWYEEKDQREQAVTLDQSEVVLKSVEFDSNRFLGILDLGGGAVLSEDSNVTVSDCFFRNNSAPIGGGIHFSSSFDGSSSYLTISSSVFFHNVVEPLVESGLQSVGGAVFIDSGNAVVHVNIKDSEFLNNTADQGGGAVWAYSHSSESTLRIRESHFSYNSAYVGAAVMTFMNLTLENCRLDNNEAFQAAGILVNAGSSRISNCTFDYNVAVDAGAAVEATSVAVVVIENSQFTGNAASNFGGAVLIAGNSTIVMANSTLDGNSCNGYGGAVSVGTDRADSGVLPTLLMSDCDVTNNHANVGGGVSASGSSVVSLLESRFIGNFAGFGGALSTSDSSSAAASLLTFENNTATYAGALLLHSNSTSVFIDCEFQYNGAAVSAGAIGVSGNSSSQFYGGIVTLNSAGQQGGGMDITANAEVILYNMTVSNNTATNGGGISMRDGAFPTLTACQITSNVASSLGGGVSVSQRASPTFNECLFDWNWADVGGGARVQDLSASTFLSCTFRRNNAYQGGGINISSNCTMTSCLLERNIAKTRGGGMLFLDEAIGVMTNVSLIRNTAVDGAGIALTDNAAPLFIRSTFADNVAVVQGGGALFADWSQAHFDDCWFNDNRAVTGTGGAASIVDFSAPRMSGCTFTNNTAENGGAVYSISASGNPLIENCLFALNIANEHGGGVSLHGISQMTVDSCTFINNRAFGSGGAVNAQDRSTPLVKDTRIIGNQANHNGGGVIVQALSDPQFVNCTIAENTSSNGGGMFFSPNSFGSVNTTVLLSNFAVFGGGLYISNHNNGDFTELQCIDNRAESSGGCLTLEALSKAQISRGVFMNNTANQGGAVFVSTPVASGDISDEDVRGPLGPSSKDTFFDVTFLQNYAAFGGGVFFSDIDPEITFMRTILVQNQASSFGGAAYFLSTALGPTYLFKNSSFVGNAAVYGGGSAAWPDLDMPIRTDFFKECSFYDNVGGYQTEEGFATSPVNMTFEEGYTCPHEEMLNNQTFTVAVGLQDYFGTVVAGPFLDENPFVVSLYLAEASCGLFPDSKLESRISSLSGSAEFQDVCLSGKNNASCTLVFSASSSEVLFVARYSVQSSSELSIAPNDLQSISCNVTLSGCPDGMAVTSNSQYDTCETPGFWTTINVLIIVIALLVLLLICILLVQLLVWYRRRRETKWGQELTVPDIYNKKEVTLKDILNDPDIPHIPWQQFTVCEKIGFGASAVVKRGLWTPKPGETVEVALKQLMLGIDAITPEMLKEFLVEIKLTSAMNHDNVVRLIGMSCSAEGDIYLVTELMSHGSIRDILDKKGRNLRWDVRLKLACDAAKGMAYLHSRSVIHRDLKPKNLLVSSDWVCKVADFGASTIKAATTQTMTVVGTPAYMAPEVLSNSKYSEKADVYSFGIILVEVYSGRRPYTGPEYEDIHNQIQLIYRILNESLKPDTTGLPQALLQLVYDCWNEEPELRPSFSEIIVRLRRLRTLHLNSMDTYPEEDGDSNYLSDTLDHGWMGFGDHGMEEMSLAERRLSERERSLDVQLDAELDLVTSGTGGMEEGFEGNILGGNASEDGMSSDDEKLNPMAISAMILLRESTEQDALDREAARTPRVLHGQHLLHRPIGTAESFGRVSRNVNAESEEEGHLLLGDGYLFDEF